MTVCPSTAAQPGRLRLPGDLLLEVIHVGVGRRARLNHLEGGEARAGADECRRHGLRLGREDVLLQPLGQRQVVGQAAVQHHRCVCVGVDQTRQDDLSAGIQRVAAAKPGGQVRGRPDSDDIASVDGHRPVLNDLARRVHRDHDAVGHEERHGARTRLREQHGDQRRGDARGNQQTHSHRAIVPSCPRHSHFRPIRRWH